MLPRKAISTNSRLLSSTCSMLGYSTSFSSTSIGKRFASTQKGIFSSYTNLSTPASMSVNLNQNNNNNNNNKSGGGRSRSRSGSPIKRSSSSASSSFNKGSSSSYSTREFSAASSGKPEVYDAVLIGGGVMSATVGVMLQNLEPTWKILIVEQLDDVALESSFAWHNAGTGHAALCELNYTTEDDEGHIDCSKAIDINEKFITSRQFFQSQK